MQLVYILLWDLFFFGLVMPNGPPLATTIIERSELINQEFLMPFFFLYAGISTDFGRIGKHWKVALRFIQ